MYLLSMGLLTILFIGSYCIFYFKMPLVPRLRELYNSSTSFFERCFVPILECINLDNGNKLSYRDYQRT